MGDGASVVCGPWSVVSGRWSLVRGPWSVVSGPFVLTRHAHGDGCALVWGGLDLAGRAQDCGPLPDIRQARMAEAALSVYRSLLEQQEIAATL